MNTKIQRRVDAKGRVCFDVAGMVTTYDEQEALDLTATGVLDPLKCPLTRQAIPGPKYASQVVKYHDQVSGMPAVKVEQCEVIS